jgi:excisionase family DNA binding protein
MTPPPDAAKPRLLYRVPEAAELLSIKRSKLYELISQDAIEVVHISSAIRVPAESLDKFVASLRGQDGVQ